MNTIITCPLGSQCEKAVDGHVERCAWFISLEGVNPQNGQRLSDMSKCAMSWIPILLVDNTQKTITTTASVDVLRHIVAGTAPEPQYQQLAEMQPNGIGYEENNIS